MMRTDTLGQKIRLLRLQANLLQKDLATTIGIEVTYLSKIESDRVIPGEKLIKDLAKFLDADVDELLLLAGKVTEDISDALQESPKVPQFLRTARGLGEDQWDKLIDMVQLMQLERSQS